MVPHKMIASLLIWHRRDLRLADNELYSNAAKIYSLFVFDTADYTPRSTGISAGGDRGDDDVYNVNNGPHFTRRLLEAVHSLRNNLRDLGGDLIVRHGNPLEIIPSLAKELQVEEVAWSEVPGYYEWVQSEKLKQILMDGADEGYAHRRKICTSVTTTLMHPDDLPKDQPTWERLARPKEKRKKQKPAATASVAHEERYTTHTSFNSIVDISPPRFVGMPSIMGDFRRVARTVAPIRELSEPIHSQCIANDVSDINTDGIPTLEELTQPLLDSQHPILGLSKELIHKLVQSARALPREYNSNVEEIEHLQLKLFVRHHAATAERNLCDVSGSHSSKLSVPLTLGTLSPRQIYRYVKSEQKQLGNTTTSPDGIAWIINHLEIRDYFLFESFLNGKAAYNLQGRRPTAHKPNVQREWLSLHDGQDAFTRWTSGKTNLPLVDAGMNELIATGYISNRIRQNIVSVLTKDLTIDWRLGAEWFQLALEDHDVAANYGNWQYFAGVGGDPKNRHFRTVSQAWRYDARGVFVRKWIDRLKDEDDIEVLLRPWAFRDEWAPIVPPESQLTWQDKERLESTGKVSS